MSIGTNTVVNAFKLTDSTKTFISNPSTMVSPPIGSIIVNNTTGQQCYVTAVDNATTLSISSNIMKLNNTYTIYSANNITEVERVNQNKIFLLTSSNLTAPTTQYPAYVLGGASINVATPNAVIGNTVDVYPSTIRQQYAIKVQYIRYPLPPQWTYTSLVSGEPLFNPGSTSYQDFELRPVFPSSLDSADVSYTTGYGEIKSSWQRNGSKVNWQFSIPQNSTAYVTLPGKEKVLYKTGDYTLVVSQ